MVGTSRRSETSEGLVMEPTMDADAVSDTKPLGSVVQIDDGKIRAHLDEVVHKHERELPADRHGYGHVEQCVAFSPDHHYAPVTELAARRSMKTTGEVQVILAGIKDVLFVAAIGSSVCFTQYPCRAQAPVASSSQSTSPPARSRAPDDETKRLPNTLPEVPICRMAGESRPRAKRSAP